MREGNNKDRVHLNRIDYAEWKPMKKQSSKSFVDGVSEIWMFEQTIDAKLHISEEIKAEAFGRGFVE